MSNTWHVSVAAALDTQLNTTLGQQCLPASHRQVASARTAPVPTCISLPPAPDFAPPPPPPRPAPPASAAMAMTRLCVNPPRPTTSGSAQPTMENGSEPSSSTSGVVA